MNAPRPSRSLATTRVVAACSTVLGPGAAWLYQSGHIDYFGDADLLNLWVVVALAMAGVVIGALAVVRGARVFGVGTLVINLGVAALYGFLGLFFGLGGTR